MHHLLVHSFLEHLLLHAVLEEHLLAGYITALTLVREASAILTARLHVRLLEELLAIYAHLNAWIVLQLIDVAQHVVDHHREVEHLRLGGRVAALHATKVASHLLGLLLLASRLLLLLLLELLLLHLSCHLRDVADVSQPWNAIQELTQILLLWNLLLSLRMRHAAAQLLILLTEHLSLLRCLPALTCLSALLLRWARSTLLLLLSLHLALMAGLLLGSGSPALHLSLRLLLSELLVHEVVLAGQIVDLVLLVIVF